MSRNQYLLHPLEKIDEKTYRFKMTSYGPKPLEVAEFFDGKENRFVGRVSSDGETIVVLEEEKVIVEKIKPRASCPRRVSSKPRKKS